MATELVAGTAQLRLISLDTQRSEQLRTSVAGELFQVTTQGGAALVIRNISNRRSCGNYAKPRIECGEFA